MSWVSLALALLRFVNNLMTWMRERELVSEGQDIEIARQSSAILAKTKIAKEIRDEIAGMDSKAVDDALRDLEPK